MNRLFYAIALAAACGLAGAARAEVARPLLMSLPPGPPEARPILDLSTPRAQAFAQANALRAAGIARTALDHRFSQDEVVGSVGFLCGLHENLDASGGGRAYGSDPHGRFVGAKLSLAFR